MLLKDTSDRTVYPVFERGGTAQLPGFSFAGNLMLMADPASLRRLPWTDGIGWVQGELYFQDGQPVMLDTRRLLRQALARLADAGFG
jgi:glutamine synthetase